MFFPCLADLLAPTYNLEQACCPDVDRKSHVLSCRIHNPFTLHLVHASLTSEPLPAFSESDTSFWFQFLLCFEEIGWLHLSGPCLLFWESKLMLLYKTKGSIPLAFQTIMDIFLGLAPWGNLVLFIWSLRVFTCCTSVISQHCLHPGLGFSVFSSQWQCHVIEPPQPQLSGRRWSRWK